MPHDVAVKFDQGKLRYDLIPADALEAEAEVYTIGANKYGDNNYLKGMNWSRVIAALQRHLKAWEKGEIHDPVDGQFHLASISWCAKTLFMYQKYGLGTDDRLINVLKELKND